MSIERLNKAVIAAGYAMAAPDEDETASEATVQAAVSESAGREIVPIARGAVGEGRGTLQMAKDWMRGMVPTFGGRAPA